MYICIYVYMREGPWREPRREPPSGKVGARSCPLPLAPSTCHPTDIQVSVHIQITHVSVIPGFYPLKIYACPVLMKL